MGAMNVTTMVTELQRRVVQLSSADATAAINRAVRWVNRQGSYTFQVSDPTTLAVTAATGLATTPATMDVGKAHMIYNLTGTPVRKIGVQEAWQTLNYNTPNGVGWDCYTFTGTKIVFFPAHASQPTSVNIIFHATTTDISGGQFTNLPKEFDDLIIDLAELEERRIYDVGEAAHWMTMMARSQDQIKTLLDGYRSVTQQPMTGAEGDLAIQERMNKGRA